MKGFCMHDFHSYGVKVQFISIYEINNGYSKSALITIDQMIVYQ